MAPKEKEEVEGVDFFYCDVADECQRQKQPRRFRCDTWGRCCDSKRRPGENDHHLLRRVRPWVAHGQPEDQPWEEWH